MCTLQSCHGAWHAAVRVMKGCEARLQHLVPFKKVRQTWSPMCTIDMLILGARLKHCSFHPHYTTMSSHEFYTVKRISGSLWTNEKLIHLSYPSCSRQCWCLSVLQTMIVISGAPYIRRPSYAVMIPISRNLYSQWSLHPDAASLLGWGRVYRFLCTGQKFICDAATWSAVSSYTCTSTAVVVNLNSVGSAFSPR